jgi:hypothetical protein
MAVHSHHRRLVGIRTQLRLDLLTCRGIAPGDEREIDRIAASAQDALGTLSRCRISATPNDLEQHLLTQIDQLAHQLHELMTNAVATRTSL